MNNEHKFQQCYALATKVTGAYRSACPEDLDPQNTVATIAAVVVAGGAAYGAYATYQGQKSAEEQAALDRAGLSASSAENMALINEMLTPLDIAGLQGQAVNSNVANWDAIKGLGQGFSNFNTRDTLNTAKAAGVDINAYTQLLGGAAMGDITGSYYNTAIGRQQIQNLLGATAPSMSVAGSGLYSQPFASGTGVGENRFLGNFLRDAEQRRQGGLNQIAGLVDFGNSFSARLNSQTAALMQSQFITPDVVIGAEAQRRSLGTQAGLAGLAANGTALGGINSRLDSYRMGAGEAYASAGSQLGDAYSIYANRSQPAKTDTQKQLS